MAERQADAAIRQTGAAIKRRGLVAGAAALVAGIVTRKTASPALAGVDGDVVLGSSTNVANARTTVINDNPSLGSGPALIGLRWPNLSGGTFPDDVGVYGVCTGLTNGIGVYGQCDVATGIGVQGVSAGVGSGVVGTSGGGYGVSGTSFSNTGVIGSIPVGSTATDTVAVSALNHSTGAGSDGVYAQATNGYGVYATSASSHAVFGEVTTGQGNGVYGTSTSGIGVHGKTTSGLYGIVGESGSAAGSAGLLGVANGPNAVGFGTIATNGATFAGYFNGTTVVNGVFAATGGKAAAVRDAAGDYRLMYCVEAPEAWFEDVGKAKLVNGAATVTLDPAFAEHIRSDDYHIFLTAYGQSSGLYVGKQSAGSFEVRASSGSGSATFSWRVMGKRRDLVGERLTKFVMPPGLKLPETPSLPPAPPALSTPQPAPAPRSTASPPAASSQEGGGSPAVQPAPSPRAG